jgi:beta-phosphoglucomutase-like phosphatase (HAD superfamily)
LTPARERAGSRLDEHIDPRPDERTISPAGERIEAAARRKVAAGSPAGEIPLALERRRAAEALAAYRGVRFGAVVFDLDGTLADAPVARADVRAALERLVDADVRVAVATGRAPTERALRLMRGLVHERYHERVLVGYRNGAQLGRIGSEAVETLTALAPHDFDALRTVLEARLPSLPPEVVLVADTHAQLTLRALPLASAAPPAEYVIPPEELLALAEDAITATGAVAKAAQSPHHVDIVHPSTSKRLVASRLGAGERPVLRIGDTGRFPGNDFELLADPYGLSVDEVSPDLAGCWNFLPPGLREVEGTLHYLAQLDVIAPGEVAFGERFFD